MSSHRVGCENELECESNDQRKDAITIIQLSSVSVCVRSAKNRFPGQQTCTAYCMSEMGGMAERAKRKQFKWMDGAKAAFTFQNDVGSVQSFIVTPVNRIVLLTGPHAVVKSTTDIWQEFRMETER